MTSKQMNSRDKGWRICFNCSGADEEGDNGILRYVEEISSRSYHPLSPFFTEDDLAHCTCLLCFNCYQEMLFIEPSSMRKCDGNCKVNPNLPVYPIQGLSEYGE